MDEDFSNVRVAVRIRPQIARERIQQSRICTFVTDGEPQITLGKDKAFTYDHVFDMTTSQTTFYSTCVHHLIQSSFSGYNATILAYGQTGAGKTYTMGTTFDNSTPEQLGIIPRAVNHLFDEIASRSDDVTFSVSAQFMELYNDDVIDLLDSSRISGHRAKLKIHEDANGDIQIAGITNRSVKEAREALEFLREGALNRSTAATAMNAESSRSHAIFSLHIIQQSMTSQLSAKIHFTDLAGSERLKRTQATGNRLREGVSINCGLLALGNVISALGDVTKRSTHVPYRDSKLTRVLQDSLGGNSRTLMVACISPSDVDFMETLSTLKYANRARNIRNKIVVNQDSNSKQIEQLRQQVASLQLQLTHCQSVEGGGDYDVIREREMLADESRELRLKLKVLQETNAALKKQVVVARLQESEIGGSIDEMVKGYIEEIEDLRSKLIESESMCTILKSKTTTTLESMGKPQTPLMNVLLQAKKDIESFEYKKQNAHKKCDDVTDDDVLDDVEDEVVDSEVLDDKDEEELAKLSEEVNIKQKLVDQLESLQKRLAGMQMQYEEKLKLMSDKIKITESERDKILESLDSKKEAEKIDKVRESYSKKLDLMKSELKKLKEAERNHQKVLQERSKNVVQLKTLKSELARLKQSKEQLDKKMREGEKRSRVQSMKTSKEMMMLKTSHVKKIYEIKRLENTNKQKDFLMSKKVKEIEHLRSSLKRIQKEQNKIRGRHSFSSGSRKEDFEIGAKNVWSLIEKQLREVEVKNATVASIERRMKSLLDSRDDLNDQKNNLEDACAEDEEAIEANLDFVQSQLQQSQMEIMQLEKSCSNTDQILQIINSCSSISVSNYISVNLMTKLVEKFTSEAINCERIKDFESKLKSSEESFEKAQQLIECLLETKPKTFNHSSETSSEASPDDPPLHLFTKIDHQDHMTASKSRLKMSKTSTKDLLHVKDDHFKRRASMRLRIEKTLDQQNGPQQQVVSPSLKQPEVFYRLMTKPQQTNIPNKGKMSLNHNKLCMTSSGLICTHVAEGHKKAVLCVQASDHLLFSGSKDRTAKVWNMVTGQEILTLSGHPNNVNVVQHCPTTGLVYTVSLCYMKVWDIRSKASCIQVLSTSGTRYSSADFCSSIYRTNVMGDHDQAINDLKISPRSNHVFCASGTSVLVWDLNNYDVVTKLTGHTGNVMAIDVLSHDNVSIATGSKDHYVNVYKYEDVLQSTTCPPNITFCPPHMDGIESLTHLPNQNILFSASRDKSIRKWDIESKRRLQSIYPAHNNWVCSLEVVQSCKLGLVLLSGGRNGLLKCWGVDQLDSLGELQAHQSTINSMACNRANRLFTASSDATVKVWKI